MDLRVNQRRRNYKLRAGLGTVATCRPNARGRKRGRALRNEPKMLPVSLPLRLRKGQHAFVDTAADVIVRRFVRFGWREGLIRCWLEAGEPVLECQSDPFAVRRRQGVYLWPRRFARLRTHSLQDYQRLSHYALGYQIPTSGPGLIFVLKHWPERASKLRRAWLYMTYR